MGVYNDVVFTDALEQVQALTTTDNADEIATRIEQIAALPDLAIACLGLLVLKSRGADIASMNGIEIANIQPTIADFILPPGVSL